MTVTSSRAGSPCRPPPSREAGAETATRLLRRQGGLAVACVIEGPEHVRTVEAGNRPRSSLRSPTTSPSTRAFSPESRSRAPSRCRDRSRRLPFGGRSAPRPSRRSIRGPWPMCRRDTALTAGRSYGFVGLFADITIVAIEPLRRGFSAARSRRDRLRSTIPPIRMALLRRWPIGVGRPPRPFPEPCVPHNVRALDAKGPYPRLKRFRVASFTSASEAAVSSAPLLRGGTRGSTSFLEGTDRARASLTASLHRRRHHRRRDWLIEQPARSILTSVT